MKTFCVGDIHGRYEALKQVLTLCKFNYNKDKLIVLGDIVDGGSRTYDVVEELLKIKNLIYIIGNHDEWFMNHMSSGWAEEIWIQQGGSNTLKSYGASVLEADFITDSSLIDNTNLKIPVTHQDFFNRGKYYHIENNMIFVHGGFIPGVALHNQTRQTLLWDRELIKIAQEHTIPPFDKIFVGHTTTQTYNTDIPIRFHNLYMVDCGAGWNGRLAILDVNSDEHWVSDIQKPCRTNILTDKSYKNFLKRL